MQSCRFSILFQSESSFGPGDLVRRVNVGRVLVLDDHLSLVAASTWSSPRRPDDAFAVAEGQAKACPPLRHVIKTRLDHCGREHSRATEEDAASVCGYNMRRRR